MRVTIQHIDAVRSVSVPGSSQLGYVARFQAGPVTGQAMVVPCTGLSESLAPGRVITVDVRQEYVSRFTPLGEDRSIAVSPLETPGDFEVRGRVIFSYPTGEFGVGAGDFVFTLREDDVMGQRPEVDDWVSFHAHGVSLWHRHA